MLFIFNQLYMYFTVHCRTQFLFDVKMSGFLYFQPVYRGNRARKTRDEAWVYPILAYAYTNEYNLFDEILGPLCTWRYWPG